MRRSRSLCVLACVVFAGGAVALEAVGSREEALVDRSSAHLMPAPASGEARAWRLGPVAGFRGEVTIRDGVPHVCVLDPAGKPRTLPPDTGGTRSVGFLVWATAAQADWPRPHRDAGRARDLAGLAALVEGAAGALGIDLDETGVAFRLEGRAASVTYHVIWREPGERSLAKGEDPRVLDAERNVRFTREDVPVGSVGVHTRPLEGTHTHPGDPLHAHVILPRRERPRGFAPESTVGGHVKEIVLESIDASAVTPGR